MLDTLWDNHQSKWYQWLFSFVFVLSASTAAELAPLAPSVVAGGWRAHEGVMLGISSLLHGLPATASSSTEVRPNHHRHHAITPSGPPPPHRPVAPSRRHAVAPFTPASCRPQRAHALEYISAELSPTLYLLLAHPQVSSS